MATCRSAVVVVSLGIAVWAGHNILTVAVWPHSLEIALVEREFSKAEFPTDRPIVLIGRPYGAALSGKYCDNVANMGCISTSMQFALPNMLRLWMRERGIDFSRYNILFMSDRNSPIAVSFEAARTTYGPVPQDALFLDIGAVVLGYARTNH